MKYHCQVSDENLDQRYDKTDGQIPKIFLTYFLFLNNVYFKIFL